MFLWDLRDSAAQKTHLSAVPRQAESFIAASLITKTELPTVSASGMRLLAISPRSLLLRAPLKGKGLREADRLLWSGPYSLETVSSISERNVR